MSEPAVIQSETRVVRVPQQTSGQVDGQVVLLSLQSGHYYGMNEHGSRIWELIEQPIPVSEIVDRLLTEFDVTRDQCESEVLSFLNALRVDQLVQVA